MRRVDGRSMTRSRRGVVAAAARPEAADAAGTLLGQRSGARLAPSVLDPLPRRNVPAERPAHLRAPRPGNGRLQKQDFGLWVLQLKFRSAT